MATYQFIAITTSGGNKLVQIKKDASIVQIIEANKARIERSENGLSLQILSAFDGEALMETIKISDITIPAFSDINDLVEKLTDLFNAPFAATIASGAFAMETTQLANNAKLTAIDANITGVSNQIVELKAAPSRQNIVNLGATAIQIGTGTHSIYGITILKAGANNIYVKIYQKNTAPIVGTDQPVMVVLCEQNDKMTSIPFDGFVKFNGTNFLWVAAVKNLDNASVSAPGGNNRVEILYK